MKGKVDGKVDAEEEEAYVEADAIEEEMVKLMLW